jgi:hypothetical protein
LSKAGQQLKILPHSVISAKGESVELCSSVECKGIVGNDGRHYILDLLRTFPPDVNFLICMFFYNLTYIKLHIPTMLYYMLSF